MPQVPNPLFTLRGHRVGVSSLLETDIDGTSYLISGDQDGRLIAWNLDTYRPSHVDSPFASRIQSLKVVVLKEQGITLVVQSRDEGIKLLKLGELINHNKAVIIAEYTTYESLFSRGDAISVKDGQALLAYPSSIENYLVTLRLLDYKGGTQISGSAKRHESINSSRCSVFDIVLRIDGMQKYLLFAGYEDGCISMYSFDPESKVTIPELKATGLHVVHLRDFDSNMKDFVSAFDVSSLSLNLPLIVCGTPKNELVFHTITGRESEWANQRMESISLAKGGCSSVCIRPDWKLVAVAGWDSKVRLFSIKSKKLLVTLSHHSSQVQAIIFVKKKSTSLTSDEYLMYCASQDGTISIMSIY